MTVKFELGSGRQIRTSDVIKKEKDIERLDVRDQKWHEISGGIMGAGVVVLIPTASLMLLAVIAHYRFGGTLGWILPIAALLSALQVVSGFLLRKRMERTIAADRNRLEGERAKLFGSRPIPLSEADAELLNRDIMIGGHRRKLIDAAYIDPSSMTVEVEDGITVCSRTREKDYTPDELYDRLRLKRAVRRRPVHRRRRRR